MAQSIKQNFIALNTYLMNFPTAKIVTSKAVKPAVRARSRELGFYIRDDSHEIDIAALSEFWSTEVKDDFFKAGWGITGKKMYDCGLGIGKVAPKNTPAKSTGLFSVSKKFSFENLEIGKGSTFDFMRYEYKGNTTLGSDKYSDDAWVSKGALYGRIKPDLGDSRLEIISTHLIADNVVTKHVDFRWVQVLELLNWVTKVSQKENHTLIVGDFNIDANGTTAYDPATKLTDEIVNKFPINDVHGNRINPRNWESIRLSGRSAGRFTTALAMKFIGFGNYAMMFADDGFRTALFNNFLWVLFVPAAATFLGLLVAQLTDRLNWGNIAKSLIFMPMAISFVGASLIWKFVYANNADIGIINAIARFLRRESPLDVLQVPFWNNFFLMVDPDLDPDRLCHGDPVSAPCAASPKKPSRPRSSTVPTRFRCSSRSRCRRSWAPSWWSGRRSPSLCSRSSTSSTR